MELHKKNRPPLRIWNKKIILKKQFTYFLQMVYIRLYVELGYPAKHNFPSLSTPVGQGLRAHFVIHNSGMRMARMWN